MIEYLLHHGSEHVWTWLLQVLQVEGATGLDAKGRLLPAMYGATITAHGTGFSLDTRWHHAGFATAPVAAWGQLCIMRTCAPRILRCHYRTASVLACWPQRLSASSGENSVERRHIAKHVVQGPAAIIL